MRYIYYRCQSCGWHFRLFHDQRAMIGRIGCPICQSKNVVGTTFKKYIEFRVHARAIIKPWTHELRIEPISEVEQ